jgi:hypothetical protein
MEKSNIAVLFQKHEKKKIATQTAPPIPVIHEELSIPIVEDPLIASVESCILPVDKGTETPTATSTTTLPTTDEVEEEIEAVEVEPPLDAVVGPIGSPGRHRTTLDFGPKFFNYSFQHIETWPILFLGFSLLSVTA